MLHKFDPAERSCAKRLQLLEILKLDTFAGGGRLLQLSLCHRLLLLDAALNNVLQWTENIFEVLTLKNEELAFAFGVTA